MESALESVIESKVKGMVDVAMQKYLGVTISEIEGDITSKLKKSPVIEFDVDANIPFKKAKRLFKKRYLARLLQQHSGNISEVARIAGIDRRSIHRIIDELRINVSNFRNELSRVEYMKEKEVKDIIEGALEHYKSAINPRKYEVMYKQAPTLSKNIVKELPELPMTLKQAESEFERKFLRKVLEQNNNNISKTAKKIGLRFETLHRKIKRIFEYKSNSQNSLRGL